jgi:hypothetical protein
MKSFTRVLHHQLPVVAATTHHLWPTEAIQIDFVALFAGAEALVPL